MLELPEAHALAQQLRETVLGKRIQNVTAGLSPHKFAFFFGEPEKYHERLHGLPVTEVRAWGGLVEIKLGEMHLVLGDGVRLRYFGPRERLPVKHQLHIEFDDFSSLVCTVQMYGGIWAFRERENDNFYYLVAKEKPSPLSEEFDAEYFDRIFRDAKPNLSVKALLATEQRIPGLGNGVLQDILFRAGIHPKIKCSMLEDTQELTLFRCVKDVLFDMTARGGRDTEQDLFGCAGGYPCILSAKTWKTPCPVCGGEITRQAYLGGNVYFCSKCQPLLEK